MLNGLQGTGNTYGGTFERLIMETLDLYIYVYVYFIFIYVYYVHTSWAC